VNFPLASFVWRTAAPILGSLSAAYSRMRSFILLVFLLSSQLSRGEGLEWLGDFDSARDRAKQESKLLFVYFTGADWCPWCKKMRGEILDQPDFVDFARSKFVFVEVNFPRQTPIGHLQLQANVALAHRYHISGYPTVLLLNPEGTELHRLSYVSGGPTAFISQLVHVPTGPATMSRPPPPTTEPEPRRKPVTFTPIPPEVPTHYGALALKAISGSKTRRMVLINNASMMTGETAKVKVEDHDVVVCCKEIRDDSALITCDGKELELKLGKQ
jgi:thioredoxin-related protein